MKIPIKRPIKVKGHVRDLIAFRELLPQRRQRFANASRQPSTADPIRDLAAQLHPERQHLIVESVRQETPTTRTFRLIPDPDSTTRCLAYFRAGQYISLKLMIDGFAVTRPFSISSAPLDALKGHYDITVKLRTEGFFTPHVWKHWSVGTRVETSGPTGFFYLDPLRDTPHIVALAGGCGITPFRAMARELIHGDLDARLTILYGSIAADDIIFRDELDALVSQAPDRLRVVHILSGDGQAFDGCETGFLNADLLERTLGRETLLDCSIFICGPQVMYDFVQNELAVIGVPSRRIRREVFGVPVDITVARGFPRDRADAQYTIQVQRGHEHHEIPAVARESVLVALERAKLTPDSDCRSGECGLCRTRRLAGELFMSPQNDGRREADRNNDFFHACAAYPMSDLEIELQY